MSSISEDGCELLLFPLCFTHNTIVMILRVTITMIAMKPIPINRREHNYTVSISVYIIHSPPVMEPINITVLVVGVEVNVGTIQCSNDK